MNKTTIMSKAIEEAIKSKGLGMSKQISSGGLFGYATYDRRTAYTLKDVNELVKQGFSVNEDMGIFLYNAFMGDK